jgi:hypothetical protein
MYGAVGRFSSKQRSDENLEYSSESKPKLSKKQE